MSRKIKICIGFGGSVAVASGGIFMWYEIIQISREVIGRFMDPALRPGTFVLIAEGAMIAGASWITGMMVEGIVEINSWARSAKTAPKDRP